MERAGGKFLAKVREYNRAIMGVYSNRTVLSSLHNISRVIALLHRLSIEPWGVIFAPIFPLFYKSSLRYSTHLVLTLVLKKLGIRITSFPPHF